MYVPGEEKNSQKSLILNSFTPNIQSWGKLYENHSYSQETGKTDIPFTMNLDTLDLMGTINILETEEEKEVLEMSNDVVLLKEGYGTPMFKTEYSIYLYGEMFGKLYCHPRKLNKNLVAHSAGLKVANHMLYTADWNGSLNQVMSEMDFRLTNVTKLDIAVDGLNHVPDILNVFLKQDKYNKKINKVGRGMFSAKILDIQKCTLKMYT